MGKRHRRRVNIIDIPSEKRWEPGVKDGVFSRTRKFPVPSQEDMIRAIYNKIMGESTTKRTSGKQSEFVWNLTDVDEKPVTKKIKSVATNTNKKGDEVWSLEN